MSPSGDVIICWRWTAVEHSSPLGTTQGPLLGVAALAASEGPPKVLKRSPCGAWRVLKWPFGRPKWSSIGACRPVWRHKWSPSGAWRAIWSAKWSQEVSKSLQVGSKRRPRGSKLAPRDGQERPSWAKEQEPPSWAHRALKEHLDLNSQKH